jgi:hypothetical protein
MTIFSLVLTVFSEVGRKTRFAKKGVTDLQLESEYGQQLNEFVRRMADLGHAQKDNLGGKKAEALARAAILREALDYWTAVNNVRNSVHTAGEGDNSGDYADAYDPFDEECFLQFMQPLIGKLACGEAPSWEVKQCYESIARAFRSKLLAGLETHFHAIYASNSTPELKQHTAPVMSKKDLLNMSRLQKLHFLTQ